MAVAVVVLQGGSVVEVGKAAELKGVVSLEVAGTVAARVEGLTAGVAVAVAVPEAAASAAAAKAREGRAAGMAAAERVAMVAQMAEPETCSAWSTH